MIYGRKNIQIGRVGIFSNKGKDCSKDDIRTPSETSVTRVKIILSTGLQLGCLFDYAEEFSSPADH